MSSIIVSQYLPGLRSIIVSVSLILISVAIEFTHTHTQKTVAIFLADNFLIAFQVQKNFQPTYLSGPKM